jgi:gas vesicle protein
MTKGKGFVTGAVVGSLLGAVTALLFAPKPGKELRADITEQAKVVGEKTGDIASTVKTHATELVDKVKDFGAAAADEFHSWKQDTVHVPVEKTVIVSQTDGTEETEATDGLDGEIAAEGEDKI